MGNNVAPSSGMLGFMSMLPNTVKVDKMSVEDLQAMLAKPDLQGPLRDKVLAELCKRLEDGMSSGQGSQTDERKLELLKKLIGNTISAAENEELGKLMGVTLPAPKSGTEGNGI